MTYRFLSLHILRKSQRKIKVLPTFSTLFPAQPCPALPGRAFEFDADEEFKYA